MKHNSQPSHHNRLTKKAIAPILAIAALTACTANAQPNSESSVNKVPVVSAALPEHTLPPVEQAPQPTATTESVIDLSSVMVRHMRDIADNMNIAFENNDPEHQEVASSVGVDGFITSSVVKYYPKTGGGFKRVELDYTFKPEEGSELVLNSSAIVSSVSARTLDIASMEAAEGTFDSAVTMQFLDNTYQNLEILATGIGWEHNDYTIQPISADFPTSPLTADIEAKANAWFGNMLQDFKDMPSATIGD